MAPTAHASVAEMRETALNAFGILGLSLGTMLHRRVSIVDRGAWSNAFGTTELFACGAHAEIDKTQSAPHREYVRRAILILRNIIIASRGPCYEAFPATRGPRANTIRLRGVAFKRQRGLRSTFRQVEAQRRAVYFLRGTAERIANVLAPS